MHLKKEIMLEEVKSHFTYMIKKIYFCILYQFHDYVSVEANLKYFDIFNLMIFYLFLNILDFYKLTC